MRSLIILVLISFIICGSVSSGVDSLDHKDTTSVMLDKTIEVKGKYGLIHRSQVSNDYTLEAQGYIFTGFDSTAIESVYVTLSNGSHTFSDETGLFKIIRNKKDFYSIKFSVNGFIYNDSITFKPDKTVDTFYFPYPMLIKDTVTP